MIPFVLKDCEIAAKASHRNELASGIISGQIFRAPNGKRWRRCSDISVDRRQPAKASGGGKEFGQLCGGAWIRDDGNGCSEGTEYIHIRVLLVEWTAGPKVSGRGDGGFRIL